MCRWVGFGLWALGLPTAAMADSVAWLFLESQADAIALKEADLGSTIVPPADWSLRSLTLPSLAAPPAYPTPKSLPQSAVLTWPESEPRIPNVLEFMAPISGAGLSGMEAARGMGVDSGVIIFLNPQRDEQSDGPDGPLGFIKYVPEPAAVLGLAMAVGLAARRRRTS